jgi:hypothetical protein
LNTAKGRKLIGLEIDDEKMGARPIKKVSSIELTLKK